MSIKIDLDIEKSCAKCYGSGRSYETGIEQPCSACNGTGTYLSELGTDILNMLKKYFRLEDIQR